MFQGHFSGDSVRLSKHFYDDVKKFYTESEDYDIKLQAGEGQDTKIFQAHKSFLKIRSSYFAAALSQTWIQSDSEGNVIFKKPNIKPVIFQAVLE